MFYQKILVGNIKLKKKKKTEKRKKLKKKGKSPKRKKTNNLIQPFLPPIS
jgi:hypothetical protein